MAPDVAPTARYHPIDLHCLQIDSSLDFNLYVRRAEGTYRLFRGRDLPFTDRQRTRLLENRLDVLYITDEDRTTFSAYLERHVGSLLADPKVTLRRKAELLYSVERNLLAEAFANPRDATVVPRTERLATETVGFLLKGPNVLHHLIGLMSDDYDTFTHSINVCVLTVSLAAYVGVTARNDLDDLAAGSLLHDIGKSEIPRDLLKKTGPLSPNEMEVMKRHVALGEAILSLDARITPSRLLPVSQHHEKLSGDGYPRNLRGDSIHLFGRLTAVADCFDAMTSNRTYQKALKAFDALTIMKGRLRAQYDQSLIDALIIMLGRSQTAVRRAS